MAYKIINQPKTISPYSQVSKLTSQPFSKLLPPHLGKIIQYLEILQQQV